MDLNIEQTTLKTSSPTFWVKIKTTIADCRVTFKEGGFKAVVKRYGWKLFAIFFVYYLVRDLIIYVFIPYIITKHFFS